MLLARIKWTDLKTVYYLAHITYFLNDGWPTITRNNWESIVSAQLLPQIQRMPIPIHGRTSKNFESSTVPHTHNTKLYIKGMKIAQNISKEKKIPFFVLWSITRGRVDCNTLSIWIEEGREEILHERSKNMR